MIKSKIAWALIAVFLLGSAVHAQDPGMPDSVIVGNFDGSPILVGLNSEVVVPIYVKTDDSLVALHIPLATDNNYVVSRNVGVLYEPFSLWDLAEFLSVDIDVPFPGFTSHSLVGVAYLTDPMDPQNFLVTHGEWVHIADFHMTTTCDVSVLGDTTKLVEGESPTAGKPQFVLWNDIEFIPHVAWGSLYFPPNSPPAFSKPQGGIIPLNEQFEVCLDIIVSDDDDDQIILTTDFEPLDYTLSEIQNVPGLISYQFRWTPSAGSAGDYPLRFTANDGKGGVSRIDITFEVSLSQLVIDNAEALPSSDVSLAVSLQNEGAYSSVGAFGILVGWDPFSITLESVTRAGRLGGFEYFFVNYNDADEGVARITGVADFKNTVISPPLQPGDGPLFYLNFSIASDEKLIGAQLPITFLSRDESDNTISDSTGYRLVHPLRTDGMITVTGPKDVTIGDININGIPYEVADVVLLVNHLTSPANYPFNAVQREASDVNSDGVPATVADLVFLLNIVNGNIAPPKLEPICAGAVVACATEDDQVIFRVFSETQVGAALFEISHAPDLNLIPKAEGSFTLAYNDDGSMLRVLAYLPQGGGVCAGENIIFSFEGNRADFEVEEISISDGVGYLMDASFKFELPLPDSYALLQNYPNPFNASTKITFQLPIFSEVKVEVFNLFGQKVATLEDGLFDAGNHNIIWEGKNNLGEEVSSGIYFCRLLASGKAQYIKMALLK